MGALIGAKERDEGENSLPCLVVLWMGPCRLGDRSFDWGGQAWQPLVAPGGYWRASILHISRPCSFGLTSRGTGTNSKAHPESGPTV